MKTNVIYGEKKFYVNEIKRTVVCKLDFYIDLSKIENHKEILSILDSHKYNFENSPKFSILKEDPYKVKFTVKGVAKASTNDNFDEDFGMKLSLTRAQKNVFNTAGKFYLYVICSIKEFVRQHLGNLMEGCFMSEDSSRAHINKLISNNI